MNISQFNRRDFIKLLSLIPPAYYMPKNIIVPETAPQQNIIVLVFDAWSARNVSLYGYPRQTTPFLEKLADKAIVYHNHYAAGHYTYPGTTGLLTGHLPWTHRGYRQSKPFLEEYQDKNLFGYFNSHHRIAYTHNQIADAVLRRMLRVIDEHKPRQKLYVKSDFWLSKIFAWDYDIASTSWVRVMKKFNDGYANSLFLSRVYSLKNSQLEKASLEDYPLGLPSVGKDDYFYLETAINWIMKKANTLPQPFLGYFHLLPPHDPYHTREDFSGRFIDDGYEPVKKPKHPMAMKLKDKELAHERRTYDEYILFVDSEINRLYQYLEENDILDNTWLIITSDHGEMFERGILGHVQPTFHNPLMHVPLMILPPGQQHREDVYNPTAAIDLLPTLLHITGKSIPPELEGELLPPFNTTPDPNRPIYGMDARFSPHHTPFQTATLMLRQGDYKLTYMFGGSDKYNVLNGKEFYELYNLKNDPEELNNLYNKEKDISAALLDTLLAQKKSKGV